MINHWPTMALQKIRDLLTQYLITDVADDDDALVGLVKIGTLQADPTKLKIAVEVHENDPHGDIRWYHTRQTRGRNEDDPERVVGPVIGKPNRARMMRRFCLYVHLFPTGTTENPMDREKAGIIKGTIVSRIDQMLSDYPTLETIMDDFGEYMDGLPGTIMNENITLSGDDRQPIYRIKLWLQFPTIRR